MKYTTTPSIPSSLLIRNLSITTDIPLHPDFFDNPGEYARSHSVKLAQEIHGESHFKTNKSDDTRIQKDKYYIHLFRIGAIRLSVDPGRKLRGIDLTPSQLLYKSERQPLSAGDLPLSLSILKKMVTPLLANPLDSRHIIPGMVHAKEHIAYWHKFDTEILLHGYNILSLHGLNHPDTGAPYGSVSERIQLGDQHDPCFICFEPTKKGAADADGINVSLILKGSMLSYAFRGHGTTNMINQKLRLVAFPENSPALVHQKIMSWLQGDYLPVPSEWSNKDGGRNVSIAKTIALLSKLTSRPCEELLTLAQELKNPSDKTFQQLENELVIESSRLSSVPIASLFHPGVYPALTPGVSSRPGKTDAEIARVYGMARSDSNLQQV